MPRRNTANLANRAPTTITQDSREVSLQANRTGEFSEIIDLKVPAGYRYVFPADREIEMYMMVHETFTTDGTSGGDPEQFPLEYNLVDAPGLRQEIAGSNNGEVATSGHQDLVLYDNGTQVAPNDLSYDNNTFTYENAEASADTLDVYYVWDESSEIQAYEKTANLDEQTQRFGSTAAAMHNAKPFSDNEAIRFQNQFELKQKERLKFYIKTGVDLTYWNAGIGDATGPNNTESYTYFRLPVYKIKA